MTKPIIKGWCPGALRPMLSGDGLVVRVRARGGRLSQHQAHAIADLALAHGNGLIDLSARANMQLRGVSEASHGALIAGLAAVGLIDDNMATEARHNILVTPFANPKTDGLAEALAQALRQADDLALPGKFGFAVDSDAALASASADIRIEQLDGDTLILRADGAAWAMPVTHQTAVSAALDLARWFIASGGVTDGRGRMAAHLARGALLPAGHGLPVETRAAQAPVPGFTGFGQMVGLAFGQITAPTLHALADLAPIRLTPWRMLLLEGVQTAPALSGLITRADNPLLRVAACTGAPGCPQALAPTRDIARALAPHVPEGQMLHISACAKGCAHPAPADIVLVARAQGFAIARNARADAVDLRPISQAELLSHPERILAKP